MESIKHYFSLQNLASFSIVGLIFVAVFGFNVIRDFPPEEKELKIIQGEIVVIEPNYAHIRYGKDIVKVKYACLCGQGWKESKLSSAKNLQAWVTEKSGNYQAWKLILDEKQVLNKMETSRDYILLGGLFALTFLFISIIAANKIQQNKNERLLSPLFEDLNKIENSEIPVEERIAIIDKLIQTDDNRLIFAFADLGTLNTLPEILQKKIGDVLGKFLAGDEDSPEDFADMLNVLQPAVKAAVLDHFEQQKPSTKNIPLTN